MTEYKPMRFYDAGVEQFTVADPRVDGLLAGNTATSPAMLNARALLAQAADRSVMVWVAGSSTAMGGPDSTGAKRFGDRFLSALQRAYPSGLGSESAVNYTASTANTAFGIHEVNRGQSGALGMNTDTPGTSVVSANADIAIFMYGSNDIAVNETPAATFETQMRLWVDHINTASAKPVIVILGNHQPRLAWTVGTTGRTLWEEYTVAAQTVAADYPESVLALDASATFEAMWNNGDTSAWSGDGIHVGDKGNAVLADVYARFLLT